MVIVSTALGRKRHRSQAGEGQMWMESEEVDSSRNLIGKESAASTGSRKCFLLLFFLTSPFPLFSFLFPSPPHSSSNSVFFKVQGNIIFGLPWWLSVKINLSAKAGDMGLILESGRSPGEGSGSHPSILAWEIPWTEEPGRLHTVHGVAKEWLNNSNDVIFGKKFKHCRNVWCRKSLVIPPPG